MQDLKKHHSITKTYIKFETAILTGLEFQSFVYFKVNIL